MKQLSIIFLEDLKVGMHIIGHSGKEYSIHKINDNNILEVFSEDDIIEKKHYSNERVLNFMLERKIKTKFIFLKDIREIKYCEEKNRICKVLANGCPRNKYFDDYCTNVCLVNEYLKSLTPTLMNEILNGQYSFEYNG